MTDVVRGKGECLHPATSEIPDYIRNAGKRYVPAVTLRGLFSVRFVWCAPTNYAWLAYWRVRWRALCLDVLDSSGCGIYYCVIDLAALKPNDTEDGLHDR